MGKYREPRKKAEKAALKMPCAVQIGSKSLGSGTPDEKNG